MDLEGGFKPSSFPDSAKLKRGFCKAHFSSVWKWFNYRHFEDLFICVSPNLVLYCVTIEAWNNMCIQNIWLLFLGTPHPTNKAVDYSVFLYFVNLWPIWYNPYAPFGTGGCFLIYDLRQLTTYSILNERVVLPYCPVPSKANKPTQSLDCWWKETFIFTVKNFIAKVL